MNIILRPLKFDDLEWLRNLRNENRQWFMDERIIEHPESQELWFRISSKNGDLNLVIIEKYTGEKIGLISLYDIYFDGATIGRMMIEEEFKRQGYMTRAMIKAFKIAKEMGIQELSLEVKVSNIPARDFYTKMGFLTYGFTVTTLIMRKLLK